MSKTVLFQTIQFSISTQFSSISIDRTLSGATTPDQSGPERNGSVEVLHIPQSSNITGSSSSDCLVLYPEHSLGRVLHLCKDAISIFNSSSQQGQQTNDLWLFEVIYKQFINKSCTSNVYVWTGFGIK